MNKLWFLFLVAGWLSPATTLGAGQEGKDDPFSGFESFALPRDVATWSPVITSGFDALLHSYPLATTDTTETIAETMVSAGIEGRSARRLSHRWRLRVEASVGSELYRQEIEGQYRYLNDERITRIRLDGRFFGRQYRKGTEYSLSSDNYEGRFDLRAYPWAASTSTLEVRGWLSTLDYRQPSNLEVDTQEKGVGLYMRSRGLTENIWNVGYRFADRVYPDTTGINRKTHHLEGDLDIHDDENQGLRVFHKSSRRLIRDETLRPSAWVHWTDFNGQVKAGSGHVYLDLQSELWSYDAESSTYIDSWRWSGVMGYTFGDALAAAWRLGLTSERLDAGLNPETYSQFGLRAAVESYGADLSGSIQLEYGRRIYKDIETDIEDDIWDVNPSYSDFNYWKIWLMANWSINQHFSLDLMANYEPENHTENQDDSSLGFASLQLVWRP